jgi:integrase
MGKQRTKDGLFKRPESRYWQFWLDGKRQSTGCLDREAARLKRAQLERAAVDPAYRAELEATLGDAVTAFLENYGTRGRSDWSLRMHRSKSDRILEVLGASTPLTRVDASAIDRFVVARLKRVKRTTVGKELTTLRGVLRLAKRHGKYRRDLDEVMPIDFRTDYVPRTRALTWDEFHRLVASVAEFHPKHAGMLVFFLATGTRKSEAERARGEDVDWDRWTVQIRGSKTAASWRRIPVIEPFRDLFEFFVPKERGALWGRWENMTRDLAVACKRAGIERVTANDLRRSHGTLLRRAGVEPADIARMLRHVDSRMAERVYARIDDAEEAGRLVEGQLRHASAVFTRSVENQP